MHTAVTQTLSFSITQPTPLASNAANVDVSCNGGNNGSVSVNVNGGTGPYSYAWNPTGSINSSVTNSLQVAIQGYRH